MGMMLEGLDKVDDLYSPSPESQNSSPEMMTPEKGAMESPESQGESTSPEKTKKRIKKYKYKDKEKEERGAGK